MSKNSKEKEKPLERIKSLFGLGKGGSSSSASCVIPKIEEVTLTAEILKDIGKESSVLHRVRAIKDLVDVVRTKRLQESAPEILYVNTCDLLHPTHAVEVRHAVLHFYCHLVQSQNDRLDTSRTHFFRVVLDLQRPEDLAKRLDLLKALTDNGKCISNFEDRAPEFLLKWMPEVLQAGKASEFLSLLVNVIKFNSSFLNKEVVAGIVQYTCILCCRTNSENDIKLGLDVLDSIVGYSILSSDILPHVVPTVCRTVVIPKLSELSWRVMHNLQGTHLGHGVMSHLCRILEDRTNYRDYTLLKGAVFFLGAALWSSRAVPTLKHTPAAVLPSIAKALESKQASVSYEAAVVMHWLIVSKTTLLTDSNWDFVLDVLEKLVCLPEVQQPSEGTQQLRDLVHDLVTRTEAMHEEGSYCGPVDRLFDIVEKCMHFMPEASVQRLIQFRAEKVQIPALQWVQNLSQLMERYFRAEARTSIREKTLDVLSFVLSTNRHLYEEELLTNIILPHLGALDSDPDPAVVKKAVQLLTDFLQDSGGPRDGEVLEIVGKVLNHPTWSTKPNHAEGEVVLTAARGLIDVFRKKMKSGPQCAVSAYKLLTDLVLRQYAQNEPSEGLAAVRLTVLGFLLELRLGPNHELGVRSEDGSVSFSPHLLCPLREISNDRSSLGATSPSSGVPSVPVTTLQQLNIAYLGVEDAFAAIVACVKQERDWRVLSPVLQGLPGLMKDRGLVLCGQCPLKQLCLGLCYLVGDKGKKTFEQLHHVPQGVVPSDLQVLVFPVLGVAVVYRAELDGYVVRMLIGSLEVGLASKSACTCIRALMLATLEMPEAMYKLFPDVLQKLAQISATVAVAVPVLEYLSNVIRIPQLYVSFVEEEYRKIFAIALPYTNPVKFGRFTVALALHVIAMWFLKCRITFRKDFVPYVIKNLRSNLDLHPEDTPPFDDLSQNRKRSSSLNDPSVGSSRRTEARHSLAHVTCGPGPSSSDTALLQEELLEMFVDLMAQYAFGACSSHPKRTPAAEYMVKNGRSMTWLVGRKLVTVTTSGCGNRAFRLGMCEGCYRTCRDAADDDSYEETDPQDETEPSGERQQTRRRHRSDVQGRPAGRGISRSNLVRRTTKDDLSLGRAEAEPEQRNEAAGQTPPGESGRLLTRVCSCWCSGWAEVFVRSATGNTSWMMRLQNDMFSKTCAPDFPLPDVTSIFRHLQSGRGEGPRRPQVSRSSSLDYGSTGDGTSRKNSTASHYGEDADVSAGAKSAESVPLVVTERSASPLCRANSSPEVSGQISPTSPVSPRSPKGNVAFAPSVPPSPSPSSSLDFGDEEQARALALRKSPRKEDRYESIPEESHQASRVPLLSKARLKLDLSRVGLSAAAAPATADVLVTRPRQTRSPPPQRGNARAEKVSSSGIAPASSFRDRGHTVSGMSPVAQQTAPPTASHIDVYRCGMNPSFVFLHLYHNSWFGKPGSERPILLPESYVERSIMVFDYLLTYETHKIGVIYVGPGQAGDLTAILSNRSGSERYTRFVLGLGRTICLRDADPKTTYIDGLDTQESDGNFAVSWQDDIMQVIYHVATLMPNKEEDRFRNLKKRHIGNDFVVIVYNDSGEEYALNTTGEFTSACIVIEPCGFGVNVVSLKAKPEVTELFKHGEPQLVPDNSLPLYVRQLALHANIASTIVHKANSKHVYVNNWLERLRHIKRIRERLTVDGEQPSDVGRAEDFTGYV